MKAVCIGLLVFAVAFLKQLNGIWVQLENSGIVVKSDAMYQFMDDLGNDLAIVAVSIAVLLGSGKRSLRLAGLFLTLASCADTAGLLINPNHYDSWLWELGCAAFGAICVAVFAYLSRSKREAIYGSKPDRSWYKGTGIGFSAKKR